MKSLKKVLIATLLATGLLGFAQQTIELNNWKFVTGDNMEYAKPTFDDSGWKPIETDRSWESQGYDNYDGYAWYRIKFKLSSDLKKNALFHDSLRLVLGIIDDCDQVFLNGKWIGQNAQNISSSGKRPLKELEKLEKLWDVSRNYTLPIRDPHLLWDKENVLAVRVFDDMFNGGMTGKTTIRFNNLNEYLTFDMTSKAVEKDQGRTTLKNIFLKNNSPLPELRGKLTMEASYADDLQMITRKEWDVLIGKEAQTFLFEVKSEPGKRVQTVYTFTESTTGNSVSHSQILPCRIAGHEDDSSGEYYDYTKTYKPERPYMLPYHKMLTMKMALAHPDGKGGSRVLINFEQALQKIKHVDQITRGIPKIVYLVGWQYNGHDDRYPAWHEVNAALKRSEDLTALESFLWLKREALKYNTTISVHINMTDGYSNSPLWDTYVQKGLIARNANGSFLEFFNFNGIHMCQICYTREWDEGLAQKRIDYIVDMLQLKSAGTVHLDAFFPRTSDYYGITKDMEMMTMRKIYRYWRDKGIDVTSEQQARLRTDPFIGLQPMTWWFDLSREQQTTIHQHLACGGMPFKPNNAETGFLFGQCMQGEELFSEPNYIPAFKKEFCTTTLQTYYQNTRTFEAYNEKNNTTTYTEGLTMSANDQTVKENGHLLRVRNDVFFPVLWKSNKEIMAFSENGYTNKSWQLPPDWEDTKNIDIYDITENGLVLKTENVPVASGTVTLSLDKMEQVCLQPAKSAK